MVRTVGTGPQGSRVAGIARCPNVVSENPDCGAGLLHRQLHDAAR